MELVEREPHSGPPPDPDAELVPVFRTDDLALLPLAKIALDGERIEYTLRGPGAGDEWQHATRTASAKTSGWIELIVNATDAPRARDLLMDLEQSSAAAPIGATREMPPTRKDNLEPPTVRLQDVETGLPLGQISESQLQFLIDRLEEDRDSPRDYYIDAATVELLAAGGADAGLVGLLEGAVAGREGLQIRWSR